VIIFQKHNKKNKRSEKKTRWSLYHNSKSRKQKNCNMLTDEKCIQSIRLFELSSYAALGIPLAFRELPTVSSTIASSRKHIFNSFKKIILIVYVNRKIIIIIIIIVILYLNKNCYCNVCRKCDRKSYIIIM